MNGNTESELNEHPFSAVWKHLKSIIWMHLRGLLGKEREP